MDKVWLVMCCPKVGSEYVRRIFSNKEAADKYVSRCGDSPEIVCRGVHDGGSGDSVWKDAMLGGPAGD